MTLLLWLLIDLVIVSFAEYAAHRWLMHRPWLDAFHFPHAMHHNRYYRVFNEEHDPVGRELNLRITWSDTLLACAFASPLVFVSEIGYALLVCLAVLHRWLWNAIHSEMHLDEGRWFTRLRSYQFLAQHHFLHHRYPDRNFNVTLPLFDWVFGTRARMTASDWAAWQKLQAKP